MQYIYTYQLIKGPHKATHGPRRSHIPAPPQEGANPASRSDAGLGGYERVATALVCETRSFGTPFIFRNIYIYLHQTYAHLEPGQLS